MTAEAAAPTILQTTAAGPGPVAVVEIFGPGADRLLVAVTGRADWPAGRLRLASLAAVDTGLAVRHRPDAVTLMPHGGPRIVERLIDELAARGGRPKPQPTPEAIYPEAASPLEARVLATIARAASPAAVDPLLAQPARWAAWARGAAQAPDGDALLARSTALDRLIDAPTVVLAGPPNAGKSSLTNVLAKASASVVADLPGTTRDWVEGMAELTAARADADPRRDAVAVRLLDLPGAHELVDDIERAALAHAAPVAERADILIAVAEPGAAADARYGVEREPDLWLLNKADTLAKPPEGDGASPDRPLPVSAASGLGLDRLRAALLRALELDAIDESVLWAFSPDLRAAVAHDDRAAVRHLSRAPAADEPT